MKTTETKDEFRKKPYTLSIEEQDGCISYAIEETQGSESIEEARANANLWESSPKLIETLRDCQDFLQAIVDGTEGTGRIDENSIMRFGERLKTTARKLNKKALAIISEAEGH